MIWTKSKLVKQVFPSEVGRMKTKSLLKYKIFILFLISLALPFCSGETTSLDRTSALLLPKESGENGCTVAGLGGQLKAGYTGITTSAKPVKFEKQNDTWYGVQQLAGAQIGTKIEYSKVLKPDLYVSTSCPLDLNLDTNAKEGEYYTKLDSKGTTLTFTKAGSFLVYLNQKEDPASSPFTVLTSGTPVQSISDSDLTDILNGNSSKTFKFSCDDITTNGRCQNYFGSFTSCLSGGTKQTSKCDEDGTPAIIGSCKLTQSGIGTIVTILYGPTYNSTTAQTYCSGVSGTYVNGTAVQTP